MTVKTTKGLQYRAVVLPPHLTTVPFKGNGRVIVHDGSDVNRHAIERDLILCGYTVGGSDSGPTSTIVGIWKGTDEVLEPPNGYRRLFIHYFHGLQCLHIPPTTVPTSQTEEPTTPVDLDLHQLQDACSAFLDDDGTAYMNATVNERRQLTLLLADCIKRLNV